MKLGTTHTTEPKAFAWKEFLQRISRSLDPTLKTRKIVGKENFILNQLTECIKLNSKRPFSFRTVQRNGISVY